MFQFATAWITEDLGEEKAQVLMYLSQEPGLWKACHRCWACGCYLQWDLKWESITDDAPAKAKEYFTMVKDQQETRDDIVKVFRKQLDTTWPQP